MIKHVMNQKILILFCILFVSTYANDTNESTTNTDIIYDGNGTTYLSGFDFTNAKVEYNIHGDLAILEGDILLGTVEEMEERYNTFETNDTNLSPSAAILGKTYRWENGIVPYRFDSTVSNTTKNYVRQAIQHWESNTPIRFVERTSSNQSQHPNYLRITSESSGCYSYVGNRRWGSQPTILNDNCGFAGSVHELGHSVGLYHEQSRQDRDQYVTIYWNNIDPKFHYAFGKYNSGLDMGSYDYNSVMHYNTYDFSTNGQKTIVAKNGSSLGNRYLSAGDIASVTKLYSTHIATITSPNNGTQLSRTSVRFSWTNTYGDSVYLRITDSNNNIITQGRQYSQSKLVNNLPSDGSTVYVKLETQTLDGWVARNYTYTSYLANPTKPSNIILSEIGINSVILKWTDNTTTEQGYRIYIGSTLIATLPANTTSYRLENLEDDTTYTYTIKAFNSSGESSPLYATFKTNKNLAWMIPAIYYPILLGS